MSKKPHISLTPVDDQTRLEELARLKAFLTSIKSQRFMGEISQALLKMLASGQITCERVRRRRKIELVFTAQVTPEFTIR